MPMFLVARQAKVFLSFCYFTKFCKKRKGWEANGREIETFTTWISNTNASLMIII